MFENSAVQPGSADRLGIGWCVRGAYWLARQPFVSLHQQAFNERWWLKVNVLGQTATTAMKKTARYMEEKQSLSHSRNRLLLPLQHLWTLPAPDFAFCRQINRLVTWWTVSVYFRDLDLLLGGSVKDFSKQIRVLAPASAAWTPIYLLSSYYQIRLIITGDDSPAAPGLLADWHTY